MNDDQRAMLRDLLDLEEGMTDWETDFVESLSRRDPSWELSERQAACLEKIWSDRCDGRRRR